MQQKPKAQCTRSNATSVYYMHSPMLLFNISIVRLNSSYACTLCCRCSGLLFPAFSTFLVSGSLNYDKGSHSIRLLGELPCLGELLCMPYVEQVLHQLVLCAFGLRGSLQEGQSP